MDVIREAYHGFAQVIRVSLDVIFCLLHPLPLLLVIEGDIHHPDKKTLFDLSSLRLALEVNIYQLNDVYRH